MREFQNGAFKLAIKEKRPILPVVITGTYNIIPKGSWQFSSNIHSTLEVLPAIETAGLCAGDFEILKNNVRAKFESRL